MKLFLLILLAFPLLTGFSPVEGPTDLGNDAYSKGEYDEALRQYREAAEGRPDSAEAHYNLGNAYYKKGEYARALEEYKEAARLDPKMADAYYNAGDSMFRMKMYEDSLKAYDSAKGLYKKDDADTEHNIDVVRRLIEKEKKQQEKQQQQQQQNKKGGQDGKQQGRPSGGQESGRSGQSPRQGDRQAGPPPMSNEELKALLEQQADEEKRLRNYFRPGEKPGSDREREIEQMLRGMGFGPLQRERRPGEPYVERDW